MLWDNDGSAADVVNYCTEIFGDGTIMDAFRRKLAREQVGKLQAEEAEFQAVAHRVKTTKERRVENATGLQAIGSIPLKLYHGFAAAFKMRAEEQGMTLESNGYECWSDEEFLNWLRKHPKYSCLFYREAPRNARIIVNDRPMVTTPAGLILPAA